MVSERVWAHFSPSFCKAWYEWGTQFMRLGVKMEDEVGFYCAGGEL